MYWCFFLSFKLDDLFFHFVQFILTKQIAHLITTLAGRSFATSATSHDSVVHPISCDCADVHESSWCLSPLKEATIHQKLNLDTQVWGFSGSCWRFLGNKIHFKNSGTPLPREWPAENGSLRKSVLNCSRSLSRELRKRNYQRVVGWDVGNKMIQP